MHILIQCNSLSLSLMVTLAVRDLGVTAVSKVVTVTPKDLLLSTILSSRMGIVTTWIRMEVGVSGGGAPTLLRTS